MSSKSKGIFLVVVLGVVGLVGCTVGPNYNRPSVDVPGTYRGVAPDASDKGYEQPQQAQNPQQAAQSLGDEKWWDVFQDPTLQGLIRTALKDNYDVRIAATRVLQAQAQLGITHADQLPSLSAGGTIYSQQNPVIGPIPAYELTQGNLTASAGWNPDFWGKYRRATEAARANLLRTMLRTSRKRPDVMRRAEITALPLHSRAAASLVARRSDCQANSAIPRPRPATIRPHR